MFYVYMVTNKPFGTIYIGHTANLAGRIWEHQNKIEDGFTARYNLGQLIWYELHDSRDEAFKRERQMKTWQRQWKLNLIAEFNPQWKDLSQEFLG